MLILSVEPISAKHNAHSSYYSYTRTSEPSTTGTTPGPAKMDFLLSISTLSKAIVIAAVAGGAKHFKGGGDAES
jgi:hypothetical protein